METSRSFNSATEEIVDSTTPLLGSVNGSRDDDDDRSRRIDRSPSIHQFLRRASSGILMMREPSMVVRETAAEQLEERQSDWAYLKPIVVLDIIRSLAFVIISIVILILSRNENPSMPLRLWIIGYALQYVLHMFLVCIEFKRRNPQPRSAAAAAGVIGTEEEEEEESRGSGNLSLSSSSSSSSQEDESTHEYLVEPPQLQDEGGSSSVAKLLEYANTMFLYTWWIIGLCWSSAGGEALISDSPQLYWLCRVFLIFEFVLVFWEVTLIAITGIAVCFCLPCVIAILCTLTVQKGTSKDGIEQLPKYKFKKNVNFKRTNGEVGGLMTECNTDTPIEHALLVEDAECCICLSAYDDGAELRELPCRHHFHCACIDKWLYINSACPLCKYNILKSSNPGRDQV